MGKDKSGKYIPPKGKPSGDGQNKAGLKPVNDWEKIEENLNIKENYTDGPDTPGSNVKVRHPNRNVDKEGGDSVAYS